MDWRAAITRGRVSLPSSSFRIRSAVSRERGCIGQAIARVIPEEDLHAHYITPRVYTGGGAESVAVGGAAAAIASGVARRKHGAHQEPTTPLEALH